ncbi:divalent cation tolerance protein CutA [Tistrella sp. BH-R2-4]|uniref:Divalent cation tolerance protein CutA n=1 Tax=Tistrella arctica TaxID=3133430 RepID=A0ABU9YEM9_9PROT
MTDKLETAMATAGDIIATLTEEFRQGLPARLDRVRGGLIGWRVSGDREALEEAERATHSLAGAAGSFGFPDIGDAARILERLLEAAQAGHPDAGAIDHAIGHLQAAIDTVAGAPVGTAGSGMSTQPPATGPDAVSGAAPDARAGSDMRAGPEMRAGPGGDQPMVVYITCGSRDEATAIGRALVDERLAACCNLIAGMTAIYRWQGAIETGAEVVLLAKTVDRLVTALTDRVRTLHSYDLPGISAWPITGGNPDFLDWIAAECRA